MTATSMPACLVHSGSRPLATVQCLGWRVGEAKGLIYGTRSMPSGWVQVAFVSCSGSYSLQSVRYKVGLGEAVTQQLRENFATDDRLRRCASNPTCQPWIIPNVPPGCVALCFGAPQASRQYRCPQGCRSLLIFAPCGIADAVSVTLSPVR